MGIFEPERSYKHGTYNRKSVYSHWFIIPAATNTLPLLSISDAPSLLDINPLGHLKSRPVGNRRFRLSQKSLRSQSMMMMTTTTTTTTMMMMMMMMMMMICSVCNLIIWSYWGQLRLAAQ